MGRQPHTTYMQHYYTQIPYLWAFQDIKTESSTKSNEQIVRETGNVLESFSSNTKEITSANERTQDIRAVEFKI